MKSREAVEVVIENIGNGIVVPTMSAIKSVDALFKDGPRIACVPLMGGASTLGLGLALARPARPVIVLGGDGSIQMQLGSLVTCVENRAPNFVHIVFNNGVWFENMVNLPVPSADSVDYAGLARSAGYKSVATYADVNEFRAGLKAMLATEGPHFIELRIEPASDAIWGTERPQPDLADFHFNRMGIEAQTLRERLAAE